jgi:hypothetical protein
MHNLPGTIEAVFAVSEASDAFTARVRAVHTAFVQQYGVTEVPLLLYDPMNDPPFSEMPAEAGRDTRQT